MNLSRCLFLHKKGKRRMLNRELLARVRDRIAEVGDDHCDMLDYTSGSMPGKGDPPCGTRACIAGHALAITYGKFDQDRFKDSIGPTAAALLGLPDEGLFYSECWPPRYEDVRCGEGDAKGMLLICDALLDGTLDVSEIAPNP